MANIKTPADEVKAKAVVPDTKDVPIAADLTSAEVPDELKKKNGITDRLLRLSIGIEAAEDLVDELERVFEIAAKEL